MVGRWLIGHWKALLVHGLLLSGFLLYCIFLSESVFERFEQIDGESRIQNVSLPAETRGVYYHIDRLLVGTYTTEVSGVAFIDGLSSEDSRVYLILKSDKQWYVFDTMTQMRPDVTAAFIDSKLDLDRSGFICNIASRKLSSGRYVLGIYVKNGNTEALQYTDIVLLKSKSTIRLAS